MIITKLVPLMQRFWDRSRSRWRQLFAGPAIVVAIVALSVHSLNDRALQIQMLVGAAVMGFATTLTLMVRDAVRESRARAGVAGMTPNDLVGGVVGPASSTGWDGGAFDDLAVLRELERTVGRPPRGGSTIARMYRTPARPPWLKRGSRDLVNRIFENYKAIVERGEVRWAAVIHANNCLYRPGAGESGAQVVYAARADVPLARVRQWARACYALKGTTPADPAERKLADMLTDELERALDWPVPPGLCDGADAITTIVELPRVLMPLGVLACNYFPVLADPQTRMAVLVPSGWWPAALVNEWVGNVRRLTQLDAVGKPTG